MKLINIVILALIIIPLNLFAQADTLLSFNCKTKETKIIPPPAIDSNKTSDYTGWNYGEIAGKTEISQEKPVETVPGSGFTRLRHARDLFAVNDYPIRTVVKFFRYTQDTLIQSCTGIMVSPNIVLTCLHAVYYENVFFDSLLIAPAYDTKFINPLFSSCTSKKFYILKSSYDNVNTIEEIALIELNEPLGYKTGWVGITFNSDDNYFLNKIIFQLGYPREPDPEEVPPRNFNGDTLYFRYGTLDNISTNYIYIYVKSYRGQSGSALVYTDNNVFYALGALWGSTYKSKINSYETVHSKIDQGIFYAFKNIIGNETLLNVSYDETIPYSFHIEQNYPNPFNPSTTIKYNLNKSSNVILKIYNLAGQELVVLVDSFKAAGEHKITWQPNGLASGIYFYRLQAGGFTDVRKMIFME